MTLTKDVLPLTDYEIARAKGIAAKVRDDEIFTVRDVAFMAGLVSRWANELDRLVSSATPSAGDVRNEALEESAQRAEKFKAVGFEHDNSKPHPTAQVIAKAIRALKTPPSKQGG